ncbi:hypothetical protein ABB37_07450 [Leptomonas pyrrhocoris]|uniref:RRM domain-containing protein n=1 Tax=Leptomonas pyrrhocoris TaxID=157538 RepID=A0A0M9FUW8_LEPPY|nr:hypothetical protein ABB37_07450 [Leptomonas pyrrhocoris]KPA76580.1 hypothetical protein ABB37_07450 [Leptomonas pyrrhocoris]|eukprot:XP_015655019.1 hypothetical protein ABB37_07450 [Leptomonas pyrrhocoris]
MYGQSSSSGNSAPAQRRTTPQPAQSSASQPPPPPPTQVLLTSPPREAATTATVTQRPYFTLCTVTSGPQQLQYSAPQQQQMQQQAVSCVASTDTQWSAVPHFHRSAAPVSASLIQTTVQAPLREAGRGGAEHSVAARPYSTKSLPSSPLMTLSHDLPISQSSTAATVNSYTAFVDADSLRGYQQATATPHFTPFFLTSVGDSLKTNLSVGGAHYIDRTDNSALYQSLSNCTLPQRSSKQQPQQPSPPQLSAQSKTVASPSVPVAAVISADATSYPTSANSSLVFASPNAREAALDTSATFFAKLGTAFAQTPGPQQQQQLPQPHGTSSNFTLQQLPSHLQTAFQPLSFTAAASVRPAVQAILIEQPTAPHAASQLPHRIDSGHSTTRNAAVQQHFDSSAADRETGRFPKSRLRRTSFSFAEAPQGLPQSSSGPQPPQQQQQQQPQYPPIYSSFTPAQEHRHPAVVHTERVNVSSGMRMESQVRSSLTGEPAPSQRLTRISFPSLTSAALNNSVNEHQFHPPRQQHHSSAPAAVTRFAHLPQSHPEDQRQHHQQLQHAFPRRDLRLSTTGSSTNTNTAAAAAASSTDAPQAITSPPQTPSQNITRRNRDKAVLFVGQLNYEATEADVAQIFSCYGKPLSVVVLKDKGKSSRRVNAAGPAAAAAAAASHSSAARRKVGGSAFVTYSSTVEADTAITALHGRYNAKDDDPDNDDEAKYLQVSYGQQTGLISTFGTMHAERLHASKPENPIPLIVLEGRSAKATSPQPEESLAEESAGVEWK